MWQTQWRGQWTVAGASWVCLAGLNHQKVQKSKFGSQNTRIITYGENGCQNRPKTEKLFRVRFCVQTVAEGGGLARIDITTPNECLASGFKSGVSGSRKLWTLLSAALRFQSQLLECRWLWLKVRPILSDFDSSGGVWCWREGQTPD